MCAAQASNGIAHAGHTYAMSAAASAVNPGSAISGILSILDSWKCHFAMTRHVCWVVGRLVCHNYLEGWEGSFPAPIGALVNYWSTECRLYNVLFLNEFQYFFALSCPR